MQGEGGRVGATLACASSIAYTLQLLEQVSDKRCLGCTGAPCRTCRSPSRRCTGPCEVKNSRLLLGALEKHRARRFMLLSVSPHALAQCGSRRSPEVLDGLRATQERAVGVNRRFAGCCSQASGAG